MADLPIPERFSLLHQGEEELRGKAAELLEGNEKHSFIYLSLSMPWTWLIPFGSTRLTMKT